MMTANRLPDANISRVYSTIVGGVIATSIIVMGNGAVAIGHNYDCPGQMVSRSEEHTSELQSPS